GGGGAEEDPARSDAGQRLHHEGIVECRHARAAGRGGPDDTHEAELPQLREDRARELLLLVPLPGVRGELGLRELANRLLEELLLLAEAEVQEEPPDAAADGI